MTLESIAIASGKALSEVRDMWHDYCQTCRIYEQSPELAEFQKWYAERLA